jgi:hypothetical protein
VPISIESDPFSRAVINPRISARSTVAITSSASSDESSYKSYFHVWQGRKGRFVSIDKMNHINVAANRCDDRSILVEPPC